MEIIIHTDNSLNRLKDQSEHDEQELKEVSFLKLFRFANKGDVLLMVVGSICSIIMGAFIPIFALLTGNMIDAFGTSEIYDEAKKNLLNYLYLGVAALVIGTTMFSGWMIAGERQGARCRREYFQSLLKQEIGWFDCQKQAAISTTFQLDSMTYQQAVGEKISTLLMVVAMLLVGLGVSFYLGWILTLVLLGYLPLIMLAWTKNFVVKSETSTIDDQVYRDSDSKLQESITAIKLVKQMNSEEFEVSLQNEIQQKIKDIYDSSMLKYVCYSFFAVVSLNLVFALAFWYGSECVFDTEKCPQSVSSRPYSAGTIVKIFYSLLLPALSLNQLAPCLEKIAEGKTAAARIFKIIDRVPRIRSKTTALIPQNFIGVFQFRRVTFAYPKDKSKNILQNLSLTINCRNSAIVGDSGCGKSTIFQLMMRFYDPDQGSVFLDGTDLKDLDLDWLRNQISYVTQEPVLFATSIRQNLQFGKADASEEEIEVALKKAEAYEFVSEFKNHLETFVGSGGGQLSGGQKQRIAIARALLKNPRLLLMDEATSALDRRNQIQILKTLQQVGRQLNTISITHRKKVLIGCDKVFYFQKGKISKITHKKKIEALQGQTLPFSKQNENTLEVPQKYNNNENTQFVYLQPSSTALLSRNDEKIIQNYEKTASKDQSFEEKEGESSIWKLMPYVYDKKCILLLGVIFPLIDGCIFPIIGFLMSRIIAAELKYTLDPPYYRDLVHTYCFITLGVAIFSGFSNSISLFLYSLLGEHTIKQIRLEVITKIFNMPVFWFHKEAHQPEKLTTTMTQHCKNLYNFLKSFTPHLLFIFSSIIASMIAALVFQWRTGLTSFGLIPLIIISQAIQLGFIQGLAQSKSKIYGDSSQMINQSIMNIRTIYSLNCSNTIVNNYNQKLQLVIQTLTKKFLLSGFMYGVSFLLQFITFALMFFFSALFVANYDITAQNALASIFLIIFAGITAGNNSNFMPDLSQAKISAKRLFQIKQLEDQHQLQIKSGSRLLKEPIKGNIEFKNVSFKYENRDSEVLEDLSLTIREGQHIGIVGSSGCGKSTIFSLLLGFHAPTNGNIYIEGINILDYDLHHLRASFGLVSQEPFLFNQSIKWNIRYNLTHVADQDIFQAAENANFVPEIEEKQIFQNEDAEMAGFEKNVGPKGSHVSGGQKQRIAIARAFLRNPSLLLLDQATSALDPDNQSKVQQSLQRIMKSKTTLNITHRLETIQNSDVIYVIEKGKLIENGTFQDLVSKKAVFFRMLKGIKEHKE